MIMIMNVSKRAFFMPHLQSGIVFLKLLFLI